VLVTFNVGADNPPMRSGISDRNLGRFLSAGWSGVDCCGRVNVKGGRTPLCPDAVAVLVAVEYRTASKLSERQ